MNKRIVDDYLILYTYEETLSPGQRPDFEWAEFSTYCNDEDGLKDARTRAFALTKEFKKVKICHIYRIEEEIPVKAKSKARKRSNDKISYL